MKFLKMAAFMVCSFMLIFFENAPAQTCFDPNYGYYDCYYPPTYRYSQDQGQALMESAFFGMILGGFLEGDDDHERWHHDDRDHEFHRDNRAHENHDGNRAHHH